MKTNQFTKTLIYVILLNTLSVSYAIKEVGNGGDPCEQELQEIREDISAWIFKDGHRKLLLNESFSHEEYKEKMNEAIGSSVISCSNDILKIGNAQKTCVNRANHIQCTRKQIQALNAEQKYRLIHHELAGIAGIETNNESEESNYFISAQLSAFLESQVVKRLSINLEKTFRFSSDKNVYEQLEKLYWESPKPSSIPEDDLVKSGRCFFKKYEDHAIPAIFFFLLLDPTNSELYRELGIKEPQDALIYFKMTEASNFLDKITSDYLERARKELNNLGKKHFSEDSTSWIIRQSFKDAFIRSTSINGQLTYLARVQLDDGYPNRGPTPHPDPVYCFFNRSTEIED